MSEARSVEDLLRRDRAITRIGLFVLCVLAWLYLLLGASTSTSTWEMTILSLFPHRHGGSGMAVPGAWSVDVWLLLVAMWWIIMIAMMAPSAAPTVLLFASVRRRAESIGQSRNGIAPTGSFAAGYLVV
jgi:predicted metal-binding membrane protein